MANRPRAYVPVLRKKKKRSFYPSSRKHPMPRRSSYSNRQSLSVSYTNPTSVYSTAETDDDFTETVSQSQLQVPLFSYSQHWSGLTESTDAASVNSSLPVTAAYRLGYISNVIEGSPKQQSLPPWPYESYATDGELSRSTAYRSVVTSEFSARSTTAYPNYYSEEADNETTDEERSQSWSVHKLRKTESVPESSEASTDSSESAGHRRFAELRTLCWLTAMVIVVVFIGVAALFNVGSRSHHPEPDESLQPPAIFHAAGDVRMRERKNTFFDIGRATAVFVKNVGGRIPLEENMPPAFLGDDEVVASTTEVRHRHKKVAVWEGKHIYEIRGNNITMEPFSSTPLQYMVKGKEVIQEIIRNSDAAVTVNKKITSYRATGKRKSSAHPSVRRRMRQRVTLTNRGTKYCETKICEKESVYLTSYLDWNVDPCTDFYGFVCGRWSSLYPSIGASIDTFLVSKIEEDMYRSFTTQTLSSNQMLKTESLINLCVNKPFANDHRSTLLDFLGDMGLRGWPFQKDTKTLTDVWKAASLLLRNLALPTLVAVSLEVDPESEKRYLISLGEPSLLIGHYGNRNSQLPEWYTMAITTCFKIFTTGKYVEIAQRVRYFASRLAEASMNRGLEIFAAHQFKVVQLRHYSNLIQLLTFVFNNVTVVHSRMMVIVKSAPYLKELRNVMHVSKGFDVLNYLGFRALVHISPLLPDQALEMAALQMKEITGIYRRHWPRWRRCVRMLERVTPAVFLHGYAEAYQKLPNKDKVWSLLNDIQANFVQHLGNAPWMSVDDKLLLKSRLTKLKLEVFHKFSAKSTHKHSSAEFLPDVEPGSIIVAYKSLARQFVERKLSRIKYERDPMATEWKGSVFDTNPIFDRESGTIFAPMAMFDPAYLIDDESVLLQVPRVATKVNAVLFTAIHEHNFPTGKLKWSFDTQLGYDDVQKCVEKHYEDSNDTRIRTEVAIQANVIDSLSLLPAFKLFLKKVNHIDIEDYGLLTGLNVTVKQLFFVLYAKGFCETMDSERTRQVLEESPFSTNSLRVNGPLRNSFRFPTFWECPSNSEMNPNQKCTIWTP